MTLLYFFPCIPCNDTLCKSCFQDGYEECLQALGVLTEIAGRARESVPRSIIFPRLGLSV